MLNNGYIYRDRISRTWHGKQALSYYAMQHRHFTVEQWRKRFEAGQITCDGHTLTASDILHRGELLEYRRAPWVEPPVTEHLTILFRNDDVIVFDKPDEMPVLPGGEYLENSLVLRARKKFGNELAPMHRLGRGTTGVILFTASPRAASAYNEMMRERQIAKTYLAVVHGTSMPDEFTIATPIGRVPHDRLGSIHDVSPEGKTAVSVCTVLARQDASNLAFLRVGIPTGRTHQIRIHLASIGHPLVGDRFYRGPDTVHAADKEAHAAPLPGDPGYLLHSWKIEFRDPFSDTAVSIVAPPRREFREYGFEIEDTTSR